MEFWIVFFNALMAVVTAIVAAEKKRSMIGWGLFALAAWIVALPILLFLPRRDPARRWSQPFYIR